MFRIVAIFLGSILLSACNAKAENTTESKTKENGHVDELAWSKCLFELDKIEAIRGRNLDDLDKGDSIARNQFMMDCLATLREFPTFEQLEDMGRYKASKMTRNANDISLNNGKR